ncbi:hypothetical protein PHJA_002076400 [Phtheirospermum japonicum]|uniref:Secreted protein n=1 Tax=Phtheirospermum japonicum TaxID=374723 RepID=A0A830CU00_9LAMI|nr:hypothetical protein PHJA_002076400 [Phtheirospermum japonicum]
MEFRPGPLPALHGIPSLIFCLLFNPSAFSHQLTPSTAGPKSDTSTPRAQAHDHAPSSHLPHRTFQFSISFIPRLTAPRLSPATI